MSGARWGSWTGAAWLAASLCCAYAQAPASPAYVVRQDHWSETDENEYSRFIAELGASDCATVNACLHDPRNPYRGTDAPSTVFDSDCADLPYVLRFYFAWKRGLPFSYESAIEPRGPTEDDRYGLLGNTVTARINPSGGNPIEIMNQIRDAVSSATYRVHPDLEAPYEQDFYSPVISLKAIRPGTVIYDPNGHLAMVWRIEADGRIHYFDAHPDFSVTRGYYDLRFVRSLPAMGAGFKNWRPQRLVGAVRQPDGTLSGGRIVLTANKDIPEFSEEQYYGTAAKPADDADWSKGVFVLNKETLDYYDFVRATMAGGELSFDPLREIGDMVDSNCDDLHYRVQAVDLAIQAGLDKQAEPERLPPNIYGTDGDWETYSTPSRDARLKTAFKELRDTAERFVRMHAAHDKRLVYRGKDLVGDMLAVYDRHAATCHIAYARSDASHVTLGYETSRRRLFDMSFDPYQCPERRWGATAPDEFATCPDTTLKAAWYEAERNLRNQIDRTYGARMDFTLGELIVPGPGKGVAQPPDTDARAYLLSQQREERP